jgi:ADP-ribose pyrophosphatase YjhB (NUDIX family)
MSRRYPDAPRPAVAALIVSQGRVLGVLRRNPPAAQTWSVPGGAQEVGERVEDALHREVREETGLAIEDVRLVDVGDVLEHDAEGDVQYHYLIVDYRAYVAGGDLCAGDDVEAARWMTLEEAAELGMSTRLLTLLSRALHMEATEAPF